MQPLTTLAGVVAALPLANVDTDMILPAQFMKTISRTGLGRHLFHAMRRDQAEKGKDKFVLDQPPWNDARFLVALENFGCGSSREHAPWALLDFGIRCVIAPSFADIFSNNCTMNGILPLVLGRSECNALIADAQSPATALLRLDLPNDLLFRANGSAMSFSVPPERKHRLVCGLDAIHQSLLLEAEIADHDRRAAYPRPIVPADPGTIELPPSGS